MKRNTAPLLRALALTATLGMPLAHAATIDFESGDLTGLYFAGDTFSSGDFTLTTMLSFGTIDTAASLGSAAPTGNATQFYFNSNDGSLLLSRTDGALFSMTSFSAAFVPLDPPSSQTTVLVAVGTLANNTTVQAFWNFAPSSGGTYSFSNYASAADFAAFGSVKQIEFRACSLVGSVICSVPTQNNGQFAIDDIAVSAVPEVSTSALMALGLAGLVGLGRRARRSPL